MPNVAGEDRDRLWHEICARSTGATFFHTPAWSRLLRETFPSWNDATPVWWLEDNVCVLPALERSGCFESMLPGVYGGPLFLEPPTAEDWCAIWDRVDALPAVFLYGNPYLDISGEPRGRREELFTQVLDLAPGFDRLQAAFRRRYRTGIRSAVSRGLEVHEAQDLEDVEGYCDVYEESLRRWGAGARGFYPRRLFRNLHLAARTDERVRLLVVRSHGDLIAGCWLFQHEGHVAYWHGAVRTDRMRDHPMHLLLATAIEDACKQDARLFDFNPSAGLAGVEHFKRGFGAEVRPFASWRRSGPLDKAADGLRRVRERWLKRCQL
jgi:hypothetical protein